MFTIHLNGEVREVREGCDLENLVNDLSLPSRRIAVELNGQVVTRTAWTETKIREGDKLEIVHFVGGG